MYIDHSVYPESERLPERLVSPEDRADYVRRICAAWDFGLVPEWETFRLFRGWRAIFDLDPVSHSPAYHAFRAWFGWPRVAGEAILDTYAERLDRREGRTDPCQAML